MAQRKQNGPRRRQNVGDGDQEYEQKILDLSRVTRVTAGGKRMRFRACLVIGDRKGRVGLGTAKGADVSLAIAKATAQARKHLIEVPIVRETIPHDVLVKFKAAKLLLKPAPKGSGIIAGGVVRAIMDIAGVPNISAKMLGSSNPVTNAQATMKAIEALHLRS